MLSCKVALLWINTSFPHLLLHQSPHEMSPSSSEYHIATLGSDDDCDDVYDGMMVMMMYTMMIVMMVMIMLFSNIRLTVSETLAD